MKFNLHKLTRCFLDPPLRWSLPLCSDSAKALCVSPLPFWEPTDKKDSFSNLIINYCSMVRTLKAILQKGRSHIPHTDGPEHKRMSQVIIATLATSFVSRNRFEMAPMHSFIANLKSEINSGWFLLWKESSWQSVIALLLIKAVLWRLPNSYSTLRTIISLHFNEGPRAAHSCL